MRNYLRLIAILLFCIGMHFSNAQTDSIPIQNNDSVTQSQQEMQTEKNNKVSELENTIWHETGNRYLILSAIFIFLILILVFGFKVKDFQSEIVYEIKHEFWKDMALPTIFLVLINVYECVKNNLHSFNFQFGHFLFEVSTVLMTYLTIQFSEIYYKNKQLVNENSFWKNLEDSLDSANKDIYALHSSDFKDFFKPAGLQYFYKILQCLKKTNTPVQLIKCKRILIIYDKKETKIEDTWIHTALVKRNEVKETERMFRNFYDMHEQNNIELFAVTVKKLCLMLETIFTTSTDVSIKNQINSVCKNCFDPESVQINKFEGLLINDVAYKPTSEFSTGMSFKSNKENEQLALMITKEIVADESSRVKNII